MHGQNQHKWQRSRLWKPQFSLLPRLAPENVVQVAMLSVYAATLAGFIVLLVQFINIMTKVTLHRFFALNLHR
jgi:hypothetical protein